MKHRTTALARPSWFDKLTIRQQQRRIFSQALKHWRHEAAERLLQQLRELDRRGVLEIGPDDLHPDRQPALRPPDRRHGRRQAGAGGGTGPYDVVDVGLALAVDVEVAGARLGMIVLERHGRHWRAEHDVELLEQRRPLGLQPDASAGRVDPFAPADIGAAHVDRIEALVAGAHRRRDRAHAFVVVGRTALIHHRAEQAHVVAGRLGEVGQQRALPRHGDALLAEAIGELRQRGPDRLSRGAQRMRVDQQHAEVAQHAMARPRQHQPPADALALLVGSGDHVERERDIVRAARHRPDDRQAVAGRGQRRQFRDGVAAHRHDAVGRLVGEHAAKVRRRAQRAADVRAGLEGHVAGRQRGGRAARRTARRPREIVGIAGGAIDRIRALPVGEPDAARWSCR